MFKEDEEEYLVEDVEVGAKALAAVAMQTKRDTVLNFMML
jgi:hypothetical protein